MLQHPAGAREQRATRCHPAPLPAAQKALACIHQAGEAGTTNQHSQQYSQQKCRQLLLWGCAVGMEMSRCGLSLQVRWISLRSPKSAVQVMCLTVTRDQLIYSSVASAFCQGCSGWCIKGTSATSCAVARLMPGSGSFWGAGRCQQAVLQWHSPYHNPPASSHPALAHLRR